MMRNKFVLPGGRLEKFVMGASLIRLVFIMRQDSKPIEPSIDRKIIENFLNNIKVSQRD